MFVVPEKRRTVQIGQVFFRLTVIGVPFYLPEKGMRGSGRQHCVVECSCGNTAIVQCRVMRRGTTKSCGCLNDELRVSNNTRHGDAARGKRNRLWNIWHAIRQRCTDANATNYERYGGRGISVCKEWDQYETFREWAYSNGYDEKLSIERVDNNGNYEPSNCRWATPSEQANNRRSSRFIEAFGKRMTARQWIDSGVSLVGITALNLRLRRGWTPENALSKPHGYRG